MGRSSNIDTGATCENRRRHRAYASRTPSTIAASSSEPATATPSPFRPITVAVPVSWQDGSTPSAEMAAFFSKAAAVKRSLSDAAGSSRIADHPSRWDVR